MKTWILRTRTRQALVALAAVFALLPLTSSAQDRLKTMPGYEQYQKMSGQTKGAVKSGAVDATWSEDSKGFDYEFDSKAYHYDIAAGKATVTGEAKGGGGFGKGGR